MSIPEEVESRSPAEGGSTTDRDSNAASAVEAPMDTAMAIDQLRSLVCGLGLGLLVVSLAFTAFVYKQNRNLVAGTELHAREIAQLQANERSLSNLVEALARYSSGKPELMAVLARHGLRVAPTPSTSAPSTQPGTPATPLPKESSRWRPCGGR